MRRTVLIVVSKTDGWFVEQALTRQGPYPSDTLALRVALVEAAFQVRIGIDCKVSIQDRNGAVLTEFSIDATVRHGAGNGKLE